MGNHLDQHVLDIIDNVLIVDFLNADFSCSIEADGEVKIKGITTTGEKTVCKNSMVFQMLSQNLAPAGHFSISFHLPGPVDFQQFTGSFETDGVLEGIVKKRI